MAQKTFLAVFFLLAISNLVTSVSDNEIIDKVDLFHEILEWKSPEFLDRAFPYYISGFDYDNRPVLVMEWGKWDSRTVSDKGGQNLKDLEKRNSQIIERIKSGFFQKAHNDSSEAGNHENEIVVLIDFDGMKLSQFRSISNIKYMMRNFAKFERIFENFAYGFIVNTNPLVDQIINLSKPYMGKFLERMEVYGSNSVKWIPQILKKIPQSQLHPVYGGSKSFKPIAIYG